MASRAELWDASGGGRLPTAYVCESLCEEVIVWSAFYMVSSMRDGESGFAFFSVIDDAEMGAPTIGYHES